jgi:hypothetical protein
LGQPRHRRRIRDGGRCEPEQAIDCNRSSAESIDAGGAAGSWRLAPEHHSDRRGGLSAHGGYRAVRSAFGGPHVVMRKARHRSCHRRGRTYSAARTATKHLTHAGTRIPIYWNAYSDRRGNSVARRRDELGDRPLADGGEPEIKATDGGAPIDGGVALSGFPPKALQSPTEWGQK